MCSISQMLNQNRNDFHNRVQADQKLQNQVITYCYEENEELDAKSMNIIINRRN